ncbi:M20 family metallopeptidase [Desulfocurvus sp. DL9XJH121]
MAELCATYVHNWLKSRQEEMLALLERMVRINSHTANKAGVDAVGMVVAGVMADMGFGVERHPRDGVGDNLVALSPAARENRGKGVLFCGHMDTVFPNDGCFEGFRRQGDRVVGPGVADMKGGLVAGIYALRALDAAGLLADMPVAFVFNSDEETGSTESRDLISDLARESALAMVFECAGLSGETCTGRKGRTGYVLRALGRAGHSGNLDAPKASAVLELAHQIIALEALNDLPRGVTVNAGVVRGGLGPNTVAPEAEALVECRYPLAEDGEALREAILALAARPHVPGTRVDVDIRPGRPPMEQGAANRALFAHVARAGRELDLPVVEDYRGGVSDANYIALAGCPVVDGMGPCGARDHSPEEFMLVDSLAARAALAAVAVRRAWDAAGGGGALAV